MYVMYGYVLVPDCTIHFIIAPAGCDIGVQISVRPSVEASVVQWLCHSPCKPGVAGSIPGFSSLSDGTINRGPVYI